MIASVSQSIQVVCILCTFTMPVWGLRLGAFNAHRFGPSKAGKHDVMDILAKITERYDIMLMQEITDISGQAILKLLQRIKKNYGITMNMSISDRLGRTSSKEQYAFLYREDHGISVVDTLHFDDGNETAQDDLFQREPYIVRFQASRSTVTDFTLVALHTMPTKTVEELKALAQVVEHVRETWSTENIMIVGDLNADCAYVPKKAWPQIQLRQDPDFWWAISDDADTTVNANTDCAYDRFVIAGRMLKEAVIADSVQVFDFQRHYNLSSDQALAVSDHYPIELTLRSSSSAADSGAQGQTTDSSSSGGGSGAQAQTTGSSSSSSGARGARLLIETVQQALQSVVQRLSHWRSDSDL